MSSVSNRTLGSGPTVRTGNPGLSTWLRAVVVLLLAAGLIERLLPLLDFKNRLFWLHMSEDGYLMQTVARNMALGLGMSTADGTIPTNGVQPLATFAYALLHALAGGSKQLAIAFVTIFATAVGQSGVTRVDVAAARSEWLESPVPIAGVSGLAAQDQWMLASEAGQPSEPP